MTSPNRDSPIKRAGVLDAAATLFAEKDYDATTLKMVARASGAAVGSITHFFGKKPGLAAAVHDDMVKGLVDRTERKISVYRTDPARGIRSLLPDLLAWAEEDPRRPRLIGVLATGASRPGQRTEAWLEKRLATALAEWVQGLDKEVGAVATLTPAQLYALILAPTICSIAGFASPSADNHKSSATWIQVLADAACSAFGPQEQKPFRPKR